MTYFANGLPYELPNGLRLTISENQEILEKSQNWLGHSIVSSLRSSNNFSILVVKIQAKRYSKVFCSYLLILDLFNFCQTFCSALSVETILLLITRSSSWILITALLFCVCSMVCLRVCVLGVLTCLACSCAWLALRARVPYVFSVLACFMNFACSHAHVKPKPRSNLWLLLKNVE